MPVIEVQTVEFVVKTLGPKKGRKETVLESHYNGFIKWRTESRHTGRNMTKAWMVDHGKEIDLTEELISGKVSYRAD